MKLTVKTQYALRILLNLAQSQELIKSVKVLSVEENIPTSFLEQICYKLKKQGILTAIRGVNGGFSLGRDAHTISFAHILLALKEDVNLAPCVITPLTLVKKTSTKVLKTCNSIDTCVMHPVLQKTSMELYEKFEALTLIDFLNNSESIQEYII